MKLWNSFLLIVVGACIAVLFMDRCNGRQSVDNSKVDSIKVEIQKRDSLIISRDTVIYRVKEVKTLITEYRIETDTVLKLIKCDSLAIACDSMASQFSRQDSLFREQITDYKAIVSVQDSLLKIKPKRRWVIIPVPIPIRIR